MKKLLKEYNIDIGNMSKGINLPLPPNIKIFGILLNIILGFKTNHKMIFGVLTL